MIKADNGFELILLVFHWLAEYSFLTNNEMESIHLWQRVHYRIISTSTLSNQASTILVHLILFIFQDDYIEALSRLRQTTTRAYKVNPSIKFEVFIHKVDGLSDDDKMDKQRDIHQRANEDLQDAGLDITFRYVPTLLSIILCRMMSSHWKKEKLHIPNTLSQ